jgi:xylulokinase
MTRVVGIDVGTSSVKGLAIDGDGHVLAAAERSYPLSTPRPGWSEQDPEDWWHATNDVLVELAADRCEGIGLSGQMHGLVALDRHARPLRPAILWNDGRTQRECAEIEQTIGFERLVELTGNRPLAGFTAPKLVWLRREEPDVFAAVESILLPKDYVRLKLTGLRATDVADASGTLLFDVGRRRWSTEVLDALELPAGWLPAAHESPEPTAETATGVPVAAGAGDQAAGALGVGVVAAGGPASVVLGTSGVVFAATDGFAPDPLARVHAFCHAVPGVWHVMGVMLSAAGSLRWLHQTLGAPAYEQLLADAAGWSPGTEGLRFAPYLAGERTPYPDPELRAAFVGLGLRHDRGALARAVLEGVAFGLRDCLDLVAASDARPTAGRVSGGGMRSELWLEILAAVLDLPLELCTVDGGAAVGAALLGGCAGGVFASPAEAVARCVRVARVVEPRRDWVEAYAELRPSFTALYPALAGLRSRVGREAAEDAELARDVEALRGRR